MLKELTGKLRYMRRHTVRHEYLFYFEIVRLGFVPCKENLVFKITSSLNDPIIVWSTIPVYIITLLPPCCLLLATGKSELNNIHPLAQPSNVTQNPSVKITIEKSILRYILTQFWRFKIIAFLRGDCLDFFYRF